MTSDGEPIGLTPTEYRLLVELMDNPGVVLDRAVLLERVWGYGWAGDTRLVDVHIQRLRAKIEDDPTNPRARAHGAWRRVQAGSCLSHA